MPELAEVEFARKQWDAGIGQKIKFVHLQGEKRVFRGSAPDAIKSQLAGRKLISSEARGKQMLFRFSGGISIGIHLGMTGRLSLAPPDYIPGKHDHLVLFQARQALVFNDPRQFGRVIFHHGAESPKWWEEIAVAVSSPGFTLEHAAGFIARHSKLPVKAVLLLQKGFPGVGNWMADEILWRAGIAPARPCGALQPREIKKLWEEARFVCQEALDKIGNGEPEPPAGWFFHQRWSKAGLCPKHGTVLKRETIGGRTTAWCPKCQK